MRLVAPSTIDDQKVAVLMIERRGKPYGVQDNKRPKGLKLRCPIAKSPYIIQLVISLKFKIRLKAKWTYEHVRLLEQQHRIDNETVNKLYHNICAV